MDMGSTSILLPLDAKPPHNEKILIFRSKLNNESTFAYQVARRDAMYFGMLFCRQHDSSVYGKGNTYAS